MRIVVAPDKFKGSLTGREAGAAMARGLARAFAGAHIDVVPVADGGDGTAQALVDALGGSFVNREVTGPDGRVLNAAYGVLPGNAAVIELARASGLAALPAGTNDPLTATTYGTGQLVAAALGGGARRVIVAIGGSATTDGGAGALSALGAGFFAAGGNPIAPGGAALATLAKVDAADLEQRTRGIEIDIACDVTNPLCGPDGAAAVYGPQKGASAEQVRQLDAALAHYADIVEAVAGARLRDVPGAGAAGGVGFGFMALAGARLRPGADLVLDVLSFDERIAGADLVVTGEGRLDRQTLAGKAPFAVAQAARRRGIPCVAIAGAVECSASDLDAMGLLSAVSVVSGPMDLAEATLRAAALTEAAAERLGRVLARRGR